MFSEVLSVSVNNKFKDGVFKQSLILFLVISDFPILVFWQLLCLQLSQFIASYDTGVFEYSINTKVVMYIFDDEI